MYERVFILEMSGPTVEFLQERLDHLPNFRTLFERGARSASVAPLQPVLASAFSTLLTGQRSRLTVPCETC